MQRRKRDHYRDKSFSRGGISTGQTEQHLKELGEHVLQAAKDALKAGVNAVVEDAKSRCPVKTGALRDSIKAEPNKNKTVYQISADAKSAPTKEHPNGYLYGQIVEFSPSCAHPFLYPALEANRKKVADDILTAIREAIRRGR